MILYITRKYPPSIGGMQRFNYKLVTNLEKITPISVIKWGQGQWILPLFVIWAFLKSLFLCLTKPIECIYVSDGLLSPLGLVLKVLTRKPTMANIHGRDIAFSLWVYQKIVPWSLKHLDKVICVSTELKKECQKRGVPEEKLYVISNGVDISDFHTENLEAAKSHFENLLKISFNNKKILITVGRLIPKKGIDSFVKNILPKILEKNKDVIYLIAGDGPLKEDIRQSIINLNLQNHAYLVGRLDMDSGLLPAFYNLADMFIMPNVPVDDDMEGFGIVAIEGGAAGLAVVASKVDGITQAIKHKENGLLIPYNNYDQFADTIIELLSDDAKRMKFGQGAREYVKNNYSWEQISSRYLEVFRSNKSYSEN